MSIEIILTSYNMGEHATEEDFDRWAIWVARNVASACGVEATVDQHPWRTGPCEDEVHGGRGDGTADDIRRWLAVEGWEAFCSEGRS